jgi:hypothetical protein
LVTESASVSFMSEVGAGLTVTSSCFKSCAFGSFLVPRVPK